MGTVSCAQIFSEDENRGKAGEICTGRVARSHGGGPRRSREGTPAWRPRRSSNGRAVAREPVTVLPIRSSPSTQQQQ